MKTILLIFGILLSSFCFAQKSSDTLTIPLGKYKFIKVGSKVYKLVTSLEELKDDTPTILGFPRYNGYGFPNSFIDTSEFKIDSLDFKRFYVPAIDKFQFPASFKQK